MRNKRISIKKVIFYICLLGLIILLVMPILWAMLLSLKTNNEIVNSPLSLPQTISFENYQRAIDTIDFSTGSNIYFFQYFIYFYEFVRNCQNGFQKP